MLCLIRCGQTTWEAEGRLHGSADLPMSDAGRAALTAELHRLDVVRAGTIYHPADEAAAQTAHLCAQRIRARTKEIAGLADPSLGLLEGLTETEFAERFPTRHKQWQEDFASFAGPEGETIQAASRRIFGAVAQLLRRARNDEIVIVLHTMALGMLRARLANRGLSDFRSLLAERPMIERYALPMSSIDLLRRDPDPEVSRRK